MLEIRPVTRILASAVLVAFAIPATFAHAQTTTQQEQNGPASLVADAISVNSDGDLVATGNVEVFFDEAHLKAHKITYQSKQETLLIEGPMSLTRGTETLILADSGALDRDLQEGLLVGARLVLNQQLQMAANQIQRVDGRYTRLYKTVASSCEVCASNPTPLWEIRAESIVHDQLEKQLYFEKAQLRVMGVPIFYLPYMRLPGPSLERTRGFLIPSLVSNSQLGQGVRIPYFLPFGTSKDLTLAPLVTNNTNTMEYRYRQAFQNGLLEFEGAISKDDIMPDITRGYLFGGGELAVAQDFILKIRAEIVSDHDYLLTYDFSDQDLLNSTIDLSRAKRYEYISTALSNAESLREGDDNATLPNLAFDSVYERRFFPVGVGGSATFSASFHAAQRQSDENIVGRDVQRGAAFLSWKKTALVGNGMLFSAGADVGAELYGIEQDTTYPPSEFLTYGTLGTELRWPLMKSSQDGTKHLLEPIVQVFYSPLQSDFPPNEDSQDATLDPGNMFSGNRFPGLDRREAGTWANIGLTYKRVSPDGLTFGATVGRVVRAQDPDLFYQGSGLAGFQSDWLASFEVDILNRLSFASHSLIDDDFSFTRSENLLTYTDDRYNISTGYIWLTPEPALDRYTNTSEWTFDADYLINSTWSGDVYWRYDLAAVTPTEAGFGLTYQNECVEIDLSLSHRFTSSDNVDPSTSVGMTVALTGFGSDGSKPKKSVQKCRRFN
ncbi:LPS-assembly protein LptD [Falsihalocynthiibacter arcticus]|uniref:LPS-assembly protein LptD n=1 Tax=Falsihalocynthiibacter arcticus TaxID=1579316 RepID=UPI00300207AA